MSGPRRALLASALAAACGVSAAGQQSVFRVDVAGVSVSVSVRDGHTPVSGLKAGDFELLDNGVPQSITAVSFETLPIDVTLLLDASRSVAGRRLDRMKVSVAETAGLLDQQDRLRLIAVQHQLRQVFPFQQGGTKPPTDALIAEGGTALYDGIAAALMRPSEPDRRQLIIAYTDGQDTLSILNLDQVQDVADHADAVLHIVIAIANPPFGRNAALPANGPLLRDLAARTGGQLFYIDFADPITDAFKTAIEEFRTSYVLRYEPTGVASDGWHDIQVHVKSGEYEVRARKGYSGG